MRAVYSIRDCCGDLIKHIECDVPADCSEPDEYDAERHALEAAGYSPSEYCDRCGSPAYRASYAGYPLGDMPGVIMTVEADTRDALVAALEAVLSAVRVAPDYITYVEVDGENNRIA